MSISSLGFEAGEASCPMARDFFPMYQEFFTAAIADIAAGVPTGRPAATENSVNYVNSISTCGFGIEVNFDESKGQVQLVGECALHGFNETVTDKYPETLKSDW